MDKLPMCRICLVQNVHMYVVGNKNLHELYEKLTDIPFVTGDSRPMLACLVCCAQLKKCYRLLTKCLEAEERLAQIMNGIYEPKPLINHNILELFHGFSNSPIQSISIFENDETESIAVKEELKAVCEGLDDVIEPNEEHSSDEDAFGDLKPVNLYDNYHIEDIQLQSHHSDSDSENDVPLMELKTEAVEKHEVPGNKQKAKKTNRTPVAKKLKLETRRPKLEDTITPIPEVKKEAPEIIQNTQNRTSTPFINTKPRVQDSIKNIALDTNCRTNSDQDIKRFKCDTCNSSFRYKGYLTKHIQIHTGERPYKCEICQSSFTRKGDLTKHIRKHSGEKPFKCELCHSSYKHKGDLTKHVRKHTGEKPFKCETCHSSFRRKDYLTQHIGSHTGEKPFKCDACQRSFTYKKTLRRHIRLHTGVKPFICDVCQRSFAHKNNLIYHIRTHEGDLTKHIRKHSRDNPFKCDLCQSSFTCNGHLKTHIRIHTGEKPFKCDICHSSFRYKQTLICHNRVHTGEKPFKCGVCPRSFGYKNNLKSHIRTHTGENP